MSEFRAALHNLVVACEHMQTGIHTQLVLYPQMLAAAKALLARPEPEPRITREEAEKLLESWHEQRLYDRHFKESLNTSDEVKEACLAAMGVSESPPAASDVE